MTVELVPHLFAAGNNRPCGQRGLRYYWRIEAGCFDTGAFSDGRNPDVGRAGRDASNVPARLVPNP